MALFRGITSLNLDGKGRLAIPTRHRDAFAEENGRLIVTIDIHERCLLIYPYLAWEEVERQIDAVPTFNRQARRMKLMLVGHAEEATLDAAGRILIPAALREYAGLEKAAVLVGQGKRLELWDEVAWNRLREEFLNDDVADEAADFPLPAALENLSL